MLAGEISIHRRLREQEQILESLEFLDAQEP